MAVNAMSIVTRQVRVRICLSDCLFPIRHDIPIYYKHLLIYIPD